MKRLSQLPRMFGNGILVDSDKEKLTLKNIFMKYVSAEGLKKFKKELTERKTVKRKDIARRIEEAKALGDLSENAEYSAAKEAQAFNEGRILELEEIVRDSSIICDDRRSGGAQVGSKIEAQMIDGPNKGVKKTFTIVGCQESDPANGKISNESPLGQALLDREVGDSVEITTPKGKVKYKITKIE